MLAARKAILESWKQSGRLPGAQRSRQHSEFATAPPSPQLLDEAKIYAQAFQMPPEQAIKHLTEKGNEITWSWKDMDAKAHQKAFTVAKAMTMDVLQMIRGNLEAAQKDGIPFEQFKKNLQPMLEESGWWGKQNVENPNTGKKEEVQLGSAWRLETIYRTNMATARAQGRYKQQKESAKFLPYLEYVQIDRANKRDEHAKLAGKIFPVNDPIWKRIFPPRGFNCGCSTQGRSQKWMDRNNRTVDDPKELADWEPDEGWDFNPEEDWKPDTSKYDQDIVAEFEQLTPPTFQPWGNSTLTPLSMVPPAPPEPQKAPASKPKAPKKTAAPKPAPEPATPSLGSGGFPLPTPTPFAPPEEPVVKTKATKTKAKAQAPENLPTPVQPLQPFQPLGGLSPWGTQGGFPSSLPDPVPPTPVSSTPAKKTATKPTATSSKTKATITPVASTGSDSTYTKEHEKNFLKNNQSAFLKYERNPKYSFLTDVEEYAMYYYTGSGYKDLNDALRRGKANKEQAGFQAILNSALAKIGKYKLKAGETLKRGVTLTDAQIAAYKEGSVVKWDSFTSTSYGSSAAFGGNVVFHITSNSGVDMTDISKFGKSEREVLLGSPTNVRVLSVKTLGGKTIIEVEEI